MTRRVDCIVALTAVGIVDRLLKETIGVGVIDLLIDYLDALYLERRRLEMAVSYKHRSRVQPSPPLPRPPRRPRRLFQPPPRHLCHRRRILH